MDYWYFHGLTCIPYNTLQPSYEHKHSMFQIAVEYLSDLGEFPSDELTDTTYGNATDQARTIMNSRIISYVPWSPGNPRPWG